MRKVYSKELGIYVFVDPVTREQIDGGLFDSIFSTAAKQLAKETIKKSATAIGTAALDSLQLVFSSVLRTLLVLRVHLLSSVLFYLLRTHPLFHQVFYSQCQDSEGWYTSVDIDQIIKYGYKVEIIEGYYWEETSKVFYDYLQKFFQTKKTSQKGSVQYTLAKLLMNGLYGKMIQRPIFNHTQTIRDNNEYWEFHHKCIITDLQIFGMCPVT